MLTGVTGGGCSLPRGLDAEWRTRSVAWVTPRHGCLFACTYGQGAAVGPQSNDSCWNRVMGLLSRVAHRLTPFARRGRGGFGSEPKEIVSSRLGSVDFRVCHRGARSGPSLTRLGRGDLLVMDCLALSEHEHSTSSDMQGTWVNLTYRWLSQHAPTCRSLHVPLRRHPQHVRVMTPQFSADNLKCSSHCPVTLFRSASPSKCVLLSASRSAKTRQNATSLPEIDAWPQGWTCVTVLVFPGCSGCWAQSGVSPHLVACMQRTILGVAEGAFDTLQQSSVKCCWSRDVPIAEICALLSHVIWTGSTWCVAILPIVLMRRKWAPRLLHFASFVAPAHGSCSSLVTVWIFVFGLRLCW